MFLELYGMNMKANMTTQTSTETYYVVWKAEYGGYESKPVTTEPVTAAKANAVIMESAIEYVTKFENAEITEVNESSDVHWVMVEKRGTNWKWYAKEFETKEAAQESIEAWNPMDV